MVYRFCWLEGCEHPFATGSDEEIDAHWYEAHKRRRDCVSGGIHSACRGETAVYFVSGAGNIVLCAGHAEEWAKPERRCVWKIASR